MRCGDSRSPVPVRQYHIGLLYGATRSNTPHIWSVYTVVSYDRTYDIQRIYKMNPYRMNIRLRPYIRPLKYTVYTAYGLLENGRRTRPLALRTAAQAFRAVLNAKVL
jgi:hypothetical protein